jgi:hypothetical protein
VITCDEQIREWMMEHSMNNSDVPAWLATLRVEVSNCERSVLSLLIRSRDEWRSERIERGVTRDEVWTTRIGPVVSCANKLVIVDRYFMSIARRADRGIESARGGGAAWLFGKIGEVANANNPVEVVIYCSDAGEPAMNDEELSLVTKRILEFSKGAVSTLTVFTAPDRQFGQIEHDRYWRIWTGSRSLTLAFGNSIDLFDSKRLQRSSNFSYSVDRLVVDDSRTVELQLEKVSTKLVVARVDSATSDAEI